MIVYNSWLTKRLLGKERFYFMLLWCCFTRYRYLEAWQEVEALIHVKQYKECFALAFLPALILSLWLTGWCMLLAFFAYHLLYWLEKAWRHHSVFDWEALEYCWDSLYLRKRKGLAWMKYYGKKTLPASEWPD